MVIRLPFSDALAISMTKDTKHHQTERWLKGPRAVEGKHEAQEHVMSGGHSLHCCMIRRLLRTSYLTLVGNFDCCYSAARRASLIRSANGPNLRRLFCLSNCTSCDVSGNPPLRADLNARMISCKSFAAPDCTRDNATSSWPLRDAWQREDSWTSSPLLGMLPRICMSAPCDSKLRTH